MVQRTVCFLVGVGFLFSCEGEQKPSTDSTNGTSTSDFGVDLDTENADKHAIDDATDTMLGGTPTACTMGAIMLNASLTLTVIGSASI